MTVKQAQEMMPFLKKKKFLWLFSPADDTKIAYLDYDGYAETEDKDSYLDIELLDKNMNTVLWYKGPYTDEMYEQIINFETATNYNPF